MKLKILNSLKSSFKDESGAVSVVEAAYIFPIVFFILVFLIITSFYQLQKSSLQADAQRLSLAISKSKVDPEIIQLDGYISKHTDFKSLPQIYPLGKNHLVNNPYRYLSSNIENEKIIESQINNFVQKNAFLSGPKITCEVECLNGFPNQTIIVTFKSQINFPGFLTDLGLPKINLLHVSGVSNVKDPAEFVRNVDLSFDAIDILKENSKIGKNFRSFVNEIGKVIPK